MMLAWVAALALSGGPSGDDSALAATRPLTLDWHATPACSSAEHLQDEIARILRGTPGSTRQVVAHVTATQSPVGEWRVDLVTEMEGATRRRSFYAESCQAVEAAVVLILALAINPQASPPTADASPNTNATTPPAASPGAAPPTTAPSPAASKSPAAIPAASPSPGRARDSPAPRAGRLAISVSGGLDTATLPSPTPGAELALAWRGSHLRLEIAGGYWLGRDGTAEETRAGAHFRLLSGEARAAYGWQLGQLSAAPVVGVHLARLSASGFNGSADNFEPSELLPGLSIGGLLAWRLTKGVELRLVVEGLHWLSRPTFVVSEPEPAPPSPIYRPSALVGRTLLGISVPVF